MACILGSVIVFVDSTVVNVALPAIQDDLGGGLSLQQWVVDAYLLTLGSLLLVGGSLGDLFGARRLFLIGIATFGLTSILCAAAPDGTTPDPRARPAGRRPGAILTPAGLAVIATTFSGEERGAAIGAWTAWTGIAFVIGPLGGGWLVEHASWRWVFLVNVPFALVTGALVAYAVPRKEPTGTRRAKVDVIGGLLCALGLAGPVFALIEEPRRGWGDPLILLTFFGGIAVFAVFLWWERRAPQPMLPLRLFARRNFSFANVETLTVYAGLSTLTFFLVLYLQQIVGYSALKSGFALVPITIVMFFLSPRVGRLSMRLGPRLFMGVGPLIAGVGAAHVRPARPGGRLLDGAAAGAPRVLDRALDDRRAADGDRARGRRRERLRHRERRQQRRRARRGTARDRRRRRARRGQPATSSTCRASGSRC